MAPSTAMWDTSEYIAAAYTFGLPHPPGNPFFVIVGHLFSLLRSRRTLRRASTCSPPSRARSRRALVSDRPSRCLRGWLPARWQRIAGAVRRGGHRRDGVHRVEPVRRERKGVHRFAHRHRARLVARRSAGRPTLTAPSADRLLVHDRVSLRPWLRESHGRHARRAGRRRRGDHAPAGDDPSRAAACSPASSRSSSGSRRSRRSRFAPRTFPALNEGEPTACRTKLELSCTFSAGHVSRVHVQLQSRAVRQTEPRRSSGVVRRTGRHVVAVLQVAVASRRARRPPFAQALLAATFLVLGFVGGWVHYQRRSTEFLVFRNAHVHDDAAAHLLPELQARQLAGPGIASAA